MFTLLSRLTVRFLVGFVLIGMVTGCGLLETQTPTNPIQDDMVIASGAIVEQETHNVQEMLLVLPDNCRRHICFWEIDPGKTTYRDFKDILLEIYVAMRPIYQDPDIGLEGVHGRVSISTGARTHTEGDSIDHVRLVVYPASAHPFYDVNQVAPSSIINAFGVPDAAFILSSPVNTSFTVFLFYSGESFVYEIEAVAQGQRLCLGLDDIEHFALHRFSDSDLALEYIDFRTPNPPPENLMDHVEETLGSLPELAELDLFCLTLK